jgi:uncharacterized membrane protein
VTKLLLSIHVLAAIVAIGPVTVAASMYPAAVRRGDVPAMRTLHRICRVYAALGVIVPVFGLATASSLGVLGDAWLLTSIALTVLAAAVLGLLVLPSQAKALSDQEKEQTEQADRGAAARRIGMLAGVFNLLWAVVVVLMITRPGSTTGA